MQNYCIITFKKEFIMSNISVKYIGHSAFFIKSQNAGILIDPFISQNPVAKFDYTQEKITHIFVTHGHSDHLGDAIEISKNTGALIVTIFELANYCEEKGANVLGVNLGGKLNFDFGSAIFYPAFHSSSTSEGIYAGCASSICFNINGVKIYHAGDTCLTQEFKTVKEQFAPQISMLPIGGIFTMDIEEAAIAAKWLGSEYIIPIHYNTFPPIQADVQKFGELIVKNGQKCVIMGANNQIEV